MFPYYLAIGMTHAEFWEGEPKLAAAYRKADQIRRRKQNEQMWLNGLYTSEALASTVGNMFSKGNKHKYPAEPFPVTEDEAKERLERERKAKEARLKAAFTAKALSINTRMEGRK